MKMYRKSALVLAVMAAPLVAEPVMAQALEEVIVTAQRRAESLQNVPSSVAAISGDDIAVGKVEGIGDIADATPNVLFNSFNVGEPRIFIRGIGSNSDSAASDPAVGMFIDDVYIGRTGGSGAELFDLERVEILRGPQSTLYGKNTNGGAVNFISSKPSQEFNAKLSATAGNYDLWSLRGLINGGLSDTLAAKLVVSARERDGYAKNVITQPEVVYNGDFSQSALMNPPLGAGAAGDMEDASNLSLRGQTLWQPSESLDVLLGFDYSKDETSGICRHLTNLEESGPLAVLWGLSMSDAYKADERRCATQMDVEQKKTTQGFLGRVDYQAEFGTLTSITAWRSSEFDFTDDLTGLPLFDPSQQLVTPEVVIDAVDEEASQFSQEFRLRIDGERFNWLAGAFYMREDVERLEEFYTQYSALIRTRLPLAGTGDVLFTQDNTTESYAVFAQVDWHVTDRLDVTYGIRWSQDEKDITQGAIDLFGTNVPPTGVPLILPGYAPVDADESWSDVTHRFSVNFDITDSMMVYALYSEGYKSGAFESQTNTVAAAVTPVDPEFVKNTEVGLKSRWWDDRIQANLTAFYMDYEDLQVFQLNSRLLLRLLNAQAESKGWEASFMVMPAEGLTLSLDYAYNDTEYTEFVDANGVDVSGNQLIRAPENSASASIDYNLPLANGSNLSFNLAYNWKDKYYQAPSNVEKSAQDAYAMIDAGISWESADESWNITAWGKNLDDERILASLIIDPTGITSESYAAPRTYGLTVTKSWH